MPYVLIGSYLMFHQDINDPLVPGIKELDTVLVYTCSGRWLQSLHTWYQELLL